ncbi:inositol 2-dehydrogenase [Pseudoponticoccus marisrubri]|uniref:Inositol 2-dehydrogenase n=1 Tax=Pseudoponticoccus marisrubri TaxID=1685382 RepID=A0A0W7WNH1_9RHOB|nr:inositol 2-dehydrogenase [Pseudoponticoccus marisrubri]KUF12127.1 inositol 2-dehydrogenase [Pseudoponticoccus marisrubri]
MLNIALIGCGRIGRMHAEIVRAYPRSRLACVHDVHAAAAEAVRGDSDTALAESPEAIFADPAIDAVIVASVTATHADYIEAAVAAGKPVLCEKPIDLDFARVKACEAAIAGTDVPVQIGFNRRFDPGHRALRDALAAGEIGKLVQLIVTSRDPSPPGRDYLLGAGGMIRDMTIHDFDLARFMLGEDEPVEVWATGAPLIDPDLRKIDEVDCAMIVMRTAPGRQVMLNNARQAPYGYDQRVEAMGSAGMLQSANRTEHGLLRFGATATAAQTPYLNFFIERYREAFALQLEAFVDLVTGQGAEVPVFDDGLRALALAEAAYRALASGRSEPVTV